MFLKRFKPRTNGTRHRLSLSSFLLKDFKLKNLTVGFKKNSGRNSNGLITVRHKVNKTKRNFFSLDFNRLGLSKLAVCLFLTKDPNRSTLIALIKYSNGAYSYILAPHGLINGYFLQTVTRSELFSSNYKIGYVTFLKNLNTRSIFFNLGVNLGVDGKYARSAGTYCILLSNDISKNLSKVRLPSNKIIQISSDCSVTLGRASNLFKKKEIVGKAGRNVLKGCRPSVRGVAMNPVDHPHGGRTKTNSPEVTPWGKIAKYNK
jgi:large subunit ribosomal protein L2